MRLCNGTPQLLQPPFFFHFSWTLQASRIRRSAFNFCSVCVCVESIQSELLNVKYFKFQVTIRNNPKIFFFFLLLDEAKAAAIIVIILWAAQFASTHSSGACLSIFSLLHLPGAGTVYRSPMVEHLVFCTSFRICSVSITQVSCHITLRVGYHLKTI